MTFSFFYSPRVRPCLSWCPRHLHSLLGSCSPSHLAMWLLSNSMLFCLPPPGSCGDLEVSFHVIFLSNDIIIELQVLFSSYISETRNLWEVTLIYPRKVQFPVRALPPKASRSIEHILHLSATPSPVDIDSGVYFSHCHIQIANQKQINGGRIDLGLSSEDMSAR